MAPESYGASSGAGRIPWGGGAIHFLIVTVTILTRLVDLKILLVDVIGHGDCPARCSRTRNTLFGRCREAYAEGRRAGPACCVPDSPPPWARWVAGPATYRRRLMIARAYFETQANRNMKAAAPAAIAIQACVTIFPLVRAARSGIDFLRILCADAHEEEVRK